MRVYDLVNSILFGQDINMLSYEVYRINEKIKYSNFVEKTLLPLLSNLIYSQKSYLEIEIFLLKKKQNDLLKSTQFKYIDEVGLNINEFQKSILTSEILRIFINNYLNKYNSEDSIREMNIDLKQFMNLSYFQGKQIYSISIAFFDYIKTIKTFEGKEAFAFIFLFIVKNIRIEVQNFEYEFYVFSDYCSGSMAKFFNLFIEYSSLIQNILNSKTLNIEFTVMILYDNMTVVKSLVDSNQFNIILDTFPKQSLTNHYSHINMKFDTVVIKLYGIYSVFCYKIHEILTKTSLITNRFKHIFIEINYFDHFESKKINKENINIEEIANNYEGFFSNFIELLNSEIDTIKLIEVYIDNFNSSINYSNSIMKSLEKFLFVLTSIYREDIDKLYRNYYFIDEDNRREKDKKLQFHYLSSLIKLKYNSSSINNVYLFENKFLNKIYFMKYFANRFMTSLIIGKFRDFNEYLKYVNSLETDLFSNMEYLKVYLKNNRGINQKNLDEFYSFKWPRKLKKLIILYDRFREETNINLEGILKIKKNNKKILILELENYNNFQITRNSILENITLINNELGESPQNNYKFLKENYLNKIKLVPFTDINILYSIAFCIKKKNNKKKDKTKDFKKESENNTNNTSEIMKVINKFLTSEGVIYIEPKDSDMIYKLLSDF